MKLAELAANKIKSYVVLEHELEVLSKDPRISNDPAVVAYQLAIEQRRDTMKMQVELGTLNIDEYLNGVKEAIKLTKKAALEAKRAGNIEEARKHMIHLQLMESEVNEAEAETEN